jgi:hypothetical protein
MTHHVLTHHGRLIAFAAIAVPATVSTGEGRS